MLSSSGRADLMATRRPWLRTECGVELIEAKGCVRPHPEFGRVGFAVQFLQHVHPQLHVVALKGADLGLVVIGEVTEIAVLDPDDVRIAQGEVDMELDQPGQGCSGIACIRHHPATAVEQFLAHAQQQRPQHRLLAREMPVNRGSADPCGGAEVLQGNAIEAVDGEKGGCGGQQSPAPALFRLAALG